MIRYLAQSIEINGQRIDGPLKSPSGAPIEKLSDVMNIILPFLYGFAFILLFFYLVRGGFDFLTSGGNEEKVKSGKAKITSALIGFILLVVSYLIVRLIAYVFGLGGGIF